MDKDKHYEACLDPKSMLRAAHGLGDITSTKFGPVVIITILFMITAILHGIIIIFYHW